MKVNEPPSRGWSSWMYTSPAGAFDGSRRTSDWVATRWTTGAAAGTAAWQPSRQAISTIRTATVVVRRPISLASPVGRDLSALRPSLRYGIGADASVADWAVG